MTEAKLPGSRPASARLRALLACACVGAIATLGGLLGFALARPTTPGGARGSVALPPVPVVAQPATRGDLGVYVVGLGTVTPLATVTLHTRVDGQLMRVRYEEGQRVSRGDLLAELDRRPFVAQLELAQGQLLRDRALLENARRDRARYQTLAQQDSIARQQYDTQVALVRQYEGTVQADEGQVASASVQLAYTRIYAPSAGRVGLRLVDPGNIVHTTDTGGLLVLTELDPITVIFAIAEDSVPTIVRKLRAGAALPVEAWNRELSRRLATGRLLTLDNEIDATTGTVRLRAQFDNGEDELFPGQFVNARLLIDVLHDATLVPTAAIQRGTRTFVYVVGPDNTAELRDVTIGPSEAGLVAVTHGLVPGERVVVDGADRLHQGSRVLVRPPEGPEGSM
jgi:multidrug efflux system membrane fusion protein